MKIIAWNKIYAFGVALLLGGLTFTANGRKIRTKHSVPKKTEKALADENAEERPRISLASDSIAFCDSVRPAIRFYGFDKTINSTNESFFISNGLKGPLTGMDVQITYYDMKGRQLHKRNVRIDTAIPAGETIRTDIKSWDSQKSFYFHKSAKPRRQATPFDVKIELLSVSLNEGVGGS